MGAFRVLLGAFRVQGWAVGGGSFGEFFEQADARVSKPRKPELAEPLSESNRTLGFGV